MLMLIFAHRGYSAVFPESTGLAYIQATRHGAGGIEADLQLSADNHWMVFHDRNLNRITGVDRLLSDLSLAELKELDAGKWFSPEFAGEKILTLDELLMIVSKYSPDITCNLEIKRGINILPEFLDQLISLTLSYNVIYSSFDRNILTLIGRISPKSRLAIIIEDEVDKSGWEDLNIYSLHPYKSLVASELVDYAHSRNILVYPWTINTNDEISLMKSLCLDGFFTDNIGKIKI